MASKYAKFDLKLFAWLRTNRENITTALIAKTFGITDKTHQRHISRQFTALEDRGVLKCRLEGTTRVCSVDGEVPEDLTKQPWRRGIHKSIARQLNQEPHIHSSPAQPVVATTSDQFEAAGGTIEKLPTDWDHPRIGSKPLGQSFTFDD